MSNQQSLPQVLRSWVELFMHRSFRDFRQFMDNAGLSHTQVGTLMRLYHCGAQGISDIGDNLGITVPAASQMVDRLVQQGLLMRTEDPHDRRFKQVTLTEQGRLLLESGIEARQKWMQQLTEMLTPEEQQMLVTALTLLTDAARQLETEQI